MRREKVSSGVGTDTRRPSVVLAHGFSGTVAQIPFNGFPRVRDRSTTATLRLLAAILWDALRGRLGLSPAYIPMIGRPGQVAVVTTSEAQRHLTTLAGEAGTTLWRNQVAPRGLLQMMRYRPALADRAPRGTLRRYPGTHFNFYGDPSVRDRALADQLGFLHDHHRIPSDAV